MESFCDDDPIGKEDSKRTLLKLRESGETCAAVAVYAISASVDAAPRGGRYLTPKTDGSLGCRGDRGVVPLPLFALRTSINRGGADAAAEWQFRS